MVDTDVTSETADKAMRRRRPLSIAVVSLIAAPVVLYTVAIFLLVSAGGWAESNPEASNLLPLLIGGALGGLAVGLFAKLGGFTLSIPAIVGALVGLGFYYLVFANTGIGMGDEAKIFTIYVPVQALAYFFACWLPSRQ
jgi:hypothetical protein